VAKKALPFVGGALGSLIPIPGIGTAVGSGLGDAVGNALEMELGELNAEDQEFETARRIVRVAGSAAQKIAEASPDADPQAVARKAVKAAVRQHIPGLVNHIVADQQEGRHGRWERRGRTIVLLDV
jgi:phage tail tape-measure protein